MKKQYIEVEIKTTTYRNVYVEADTKEDAAANIWNGLLKGWINFKANDGEYIFPEKDVKKVLIIEEEEDDNKNI